MKDEYLRKALKDFAEDTGLNPIILDDQAYDRSIVGVTDDGRIVYDYRKMVHELAEEDKCTDEDAEEWIDYNTMRALPYMGVCAPIVIKYDVIHIKAAYGDE